MFSSRRSTPRRRGSAACCRPKYALSVATSAEAALAGADKRSDDDARAARTRAAVETLANRRAAAEQEHADAVIAGDRAKAAQVRSELLDAWRSERIARGDGHGEVNASVRAYERQLRETALRHRLAQLDDAGIGRALEDDDALADPDAAQRIADDILRLRHADHARAGAASIARELERRNPHFRGDFGQIDRPEEETRTRYTLRREAQARRGIPDADRRLLTNAARETLAREYLGRESLGRESLGGIAAPL